MSVDKSWLTSPRNSPEYEQGLNSFIEMCKGQIDSKGNVRCACAKCKNCGLIPFTKMKFHMYSFGFYRYYTTWVYHGDRPRPPVVVVDDVAPRNDKDGVIKDLTGKRKEKDANLNEGNSGTKSKCVRDDFEDIFKEELYPGCTKYSTGDFLAKLMHLKAEEELTDTSIDQLLKLLQTSLPKGNKVPPSCDVAKEMLKKTGLGHQM
ncbi:putative Transposase-associated domain-containing protein [Helianthus annuus]|nr:putative Transposase-associated domain-containing protein [Helianthus annuus]KAJ0881133.1 putative Transposase-associated domain-containing protein [Helianthus annuus]